MRALHMQVHKKGLVMQDGGVALEHLNVKLVDFGSAVHRCAPPSRALILP
jgi:hypothetical protein